MVLFYAEVLRSVGARDHNFKLLASNDPSTSTIAWAKDIGVTATSDGDILTFSGTSSGLGVTYFPSPANLSTTTFPYLVFRAKQANPGTLAIAVFNSGATLNFSVTLTANWKTYTVGPMTSGRTITSILFANQGVAGSINFDNAAVCASPPLQLSQTDLIFGAVTKTALGADHAEFQMNNWRGKFMTSPNNFTFGDHLHVWLGQGATPFHVYGGYAELKEPVMPSDEIVINSRGYGLALLRSRVLNIYGAVSGGTQPTPQSIFNDMVDTWINNASKNNLLDTNSATIPSNYQLTRSFVQNIGSSIPLYVTSLNYAYNSMREIADLTVGQGNPGVFFVDPAENLHFVPLGTQGSANWGTDPFPALYGGSIAYGQNLVTTRLGYDSKSLATRVHYYGIAQTPGMVDGITEYATNGALTADWGFGQITTSGTGSLTTVTSPIAVGGHSNDFHVSPGGINGCGGTCFYKLPSALDVTKMGSQWTPPIIELYIRFHGNGTSSTHSFFPSYIYFGSDKPVALTDYFQYRLQNSGPGLQNSILMADNPQQDYWYHVLVPIGPNAGNLFLAAPTPNMIAQPTLLTAPWLANNIGSPNWNNINYIGFTANYSTNDGTNGSLDIYIDGMRILAPRYRLAYDKRTVAQGRYPDMSEQYFYDPVSKDEDAIKKFAQAELLRLRNPILRGTIVTPLLGDLLPEQQVKCTMPSANLSNAYLRCTQVVHRFSQNGVLTEASVSNDFGNSQPLDLWKLSNVLLQMGENAIFSRELLDLRSAILDPTFTPITDGYS
jgi:hypothetical protein